MQTYPTNDGSGARYIDLAPLHPQYGNLEVGVEDSEFGGAPRYGKLARFTVCVETVIVYEFTAVWGKL